VAIFVIEEEKIVGVKRVAEDRVEDIACDFEDTYSIHFSTLRKWFLSFFDVCELLFSMGCIFPLIV